MALAVAHTDDFSKLLSFSMPFYKRLILLALLARQCHAATMLAQPNRHLPPHLQELCAILARGLLRLRRRMTETVSPETTDVGEFRLHSVPPQRVCANRRNRRRA